MEQETKSLLTFLSESRAGPAEAKSANVRGFPGPQVGNYKIKPKDYDAFLDSLHQYIFVEGGAANLVEVHRDYSPILIDLDFKYKSGGPLERQFNDEHIYNFCFSYAKILCHFFQIESLEEPLRFIVQLKPGPEKAVKNKEHIHKDGIHIICPDVSVTPDIQHALRGYVIEQGLVQEIFGETGIINPVTDIFDRAVIAQNGWFFYGACKHDIPRYKNTKIYLLETTGEQTIQLNPKSLDEYTNRQMLSILSIRKNHIELKFCDLREERREMWDKLVGTWLAGDPKANIVISVKQTTEIMDDQTVSVRAAYTAEDIAMAFRLARECLNPDERAGTYHKWVHLALCLRNICDNREAFDTWVDISKRVSGYEHTSDGEFAEKWLALRSSQAQLEKQVKMGTLYHWVKQDNLTQYEKIRDEDNVDYAYNHDSGTHVEVANLMTRLFRHEYRCSPNLKNYDWFHYEGHYWKPVQQPMELRGSISTRIWRLYTQAEKKINEIELNPSTSEDMKKSLAEKKKRILKVKQNLENSNFKDSIMKELTEKFYQEDFRDKLNIKVNLVGVGNGVIDLEAFDPVTGNLTVEFREGRPDDNISLQMGKHKVYPALNYIPYDPTNPHNAEIHEFFRKLFPRDDLREYFLTLLSACLFGRNKEQKFYILQGEGSNGKSALMRLVEMIYGEYQCSTQATIITRKQDGSGSAAPQLVKLKNMRFVSLQEPEEGEKINSSLMKQLSGEDMISARGLFQGLETFAIVGRIFLCCNRFPPVNSIDNGTWRRLRVLKFESEFRDPEMFKDEAHIKEMAKKNIYPKEPSVEKSPVNGFPAWREAFLSMLVWYYKEKYLARGSELREPPCVKEESDKYKSENDSFASFIQERLIAEIGSELDFKSITTEYKTWLQSEPDKKKLSPADVRQKLIDKFQKPIMRKGKEMFQGVRIAGLSEDVSGNYVEPAVEEPIEEKEETIVTEQESLTIIEPAVETKKAGKPKKK
jgi:P4 family phage/plasmid primase-like protien